VSTPLDKVRTYLQEHAERRGTGATEADLRELGALWGPLPADFAAYLKEFGWATVGPHEILGLGHGVEWHQNLLERARELWRGDGSYKLPAELLPIYDSGGGWFYCLSKLHRGHPVVCWAHEFEEQGEPQPYDMKYPSWSDWFLEHVARETVKR